MADQAERRGWDGGQAAGVQVGHTGLPGEHPGQRTGAGPPAAGAGALISGIALCAIRDRHTVAQSDRHWLSSRLRLCLARCADRCGDRVDHPQDPPPAEADALPAWAFELIPPGLEPGAAVPAAGTVAAPTDPLLGAVSFTRPSSVISWLVIIGVSIPGFFLSIVAALVTSPWAFEQLIRA